MVFPATELQIQIQALLGYLPAVRDGEVDGIHEARVVTRRLREALPLFARSFPDDVARVKRLLKRAGRKFGRVRQLDVMDADLARRGGRLPLAMAAITSARKTVARRQASARRRLIKTLDKLHLDRRNQLRLRHRRDWWHPFDETLATGWTTVLRERIARRADELGRAMDHAAGVYLPNRVHAVRIAAKKLRYSMELAVAGGLRQTDDAVADLKRAQQTLGRLHDAHVLMESLDRLVDGEDVNRLEVTMLEDDLRGEIAERHAKYLSHRDPLRAALQTCAAFADRLRPKRRAAVRIVALSAIAVPAGLLMIGDGRDDDERYPGSVSAREPSQL